MTAPARPSKPVAKAPQRPMATCLPPTAPEVSEFQVNPVFESEADMTEWLTKNIPGAVVIRKWEVTMFACVVRAKTPRGSLITIKKPTRKLPS